MKAILFLTVLLSANAFAGSYEWEYKHLARAQRAELVARANNPQLYAALDSRIDLEGQLEAFTTKRERLEREKAMLCRPHPAATDHGVLASVDTEFEYMKACKTSMVYKDQVSALEAKIQAAADDENAYANALELNRQEIAFWQTRLKR